MFMKSPSKSPYPPTSSPVTTTMKDLYDAIENGEVHRVERMVDNGGGYYVNPNKIVVGMEMSLLHLAVGLSENCADIVKILLRVGGDPNNKKISEKLSPLHLSVVYDFEEVMNVLLSHGGDPHALNGDGKSCFHIAQENLSSLNEKCFELLYRKYCSFRKTLRQSDFNFTNIKGIKDESEFTGYYSFDSSIEESVLHTSGRKSATPKSNGQPPKIHPTKINYSYLTTDDEDEYDHGSCNNTSNENDKLRTIEEETESLSSISAYKYESDSANGSSLEGLSCANSTPPLLVSPTKGQLERLQTRMQRLSIPVTTTTYPVLVQFEGNEDTLAETLEASSSQASKMSNELYLSLQDLNYINDYGKHQVDLVQKQNADHTGSEKRTSKSYYNYLLLKPKIIKRTNFSGSHLKSSVIKSAEKFETFLSAIFYIGKGCGKRPLHHLSEAKAKLQETRWEKVETEEKVETILDIWKSGMGVIVVSVFHHSSESEANINEAAMIDAIGLDGLSNLRKGSYGSTHASKWPQKSKNQYGSFLLYKSFCNFAVSEAKYFFPQDV